VQIFSGDTEAGFYCLPVCGGQESVLFRSSAHAEAAGFKACPDCRPDRVERPVSGDLPDLVCRAVQLVLHGSLDAHTEPVLEQELAVSSRHLRRLFARYVGVTPDQLARSRRVHFARRLIDDTELAMADIAFAAGFGSVRQFNRELSQVFDAPPSVLRARRSDDRSSTEGGLEVDLNTATSYDWDSVLEQLAHWAVPGVESVQGRTYRRTITVEGRHGLIEIYPDDSHDAGSPIRGTRLKARIHLPVWHQLVHLIGRANAMTGLEFDDDSGQRTLRETSLGGLVDRRPRLRVAGAWDGFEAVLSAILTEHGNGAEALRHLIDRYGTRLEGLPAGLTHVFPSPAVLESADLTTLDLPRDIAQAIREIAARVRTRQLNLTTGVDHDGLTADLRGIPGVSDGVVEQVAMRLGYRDAWPSSHPSINRIIAARSDDPNGQSWRPWRSLATTYLLLDA
jgi:AraC family transcriptional regulator of adaptative response / DNA-3-methyladenine glycosylase II